MGTATAAALDPTPVALSPAEQVLARVDRLLSAAHSYDLIRAAVDRGCGMVAGLEIAGVLDPVDGMALDREISARGNARLRERSGPLALVGA